MEDLERNQDTGCPNGNEGAERTVSASDAQNSEPSCSQTEQDASALVSAENELPSEQVKTVYHWNYGESQKIEEGKKRKKGRNGAVIYASVVSLAFILCFAALICVLVFDFSSNSPETNINGSITETVVKVEERVVYVREYDEESGVLTTQEIYNKCLPSTVSIIVSDGTQSGTGSGFIISEDGYIATANHVIEGMEAIKVILSNGKMYEAETIGGNEYTDLALLKIDEDGLTPIKIGKSSKLLVGDDVVAIGTPASTDFAGSMAKGSVSYKDRMLKIYNSANTAVEKKMRLIQTDALVNPGNSGCPLINEYGEAIGVVTMKLNSTYYEGMCFAIPMDAAMPILEAMRDGEEYDSLLSAVSVAPAVLGITGENVQMTDSGVYGIRIADFASQSYDAASKLKKNDIITHFNGVAVASITELRLMIDKTLPGQTVSISFYRDGQYMTVYVVMGS